MNERHLPGGRLCLLAVSFAAASCLAATPTNAAFVIDFEGFANGLEVGSGVHGVGVEPYPGFFLLTGNSSGSPVQGAAIFDSTPFGPNAAGPDPDLLVGLGNILILQNDAFATQTLSGIYDTPDDEELGGTLIFDFVSPFNLLSIDLIDINGNGPATLTLEDSNGNTRVYSVPMFWTNDIFVDGRAGFDTLDLTILTDQVGEGGGTATAVEDPLFDPVDVIRLTVVHTGSAGIDNLTFIPAPGALALLGLAGLMGMPRRRRLA